MRDGWGEHTAPGAPAVRWGPWCVSAWNKQAWKRHRLTGVHARWPRSGIRPGVDAGFAERQPEERLGGERAVEARSRVFSRWGLEPREPAAAGVGVSRGCDVRSRRQVHDKLERITGLHASA